MKADLVLKVYALLMRHVLPSSNANSGENEEVPSPQEQEQGQDECDFKYEETMRRISALGWSSDLRDLPEMNFIQLYDNLVVSTRKYRHIVLKGTHYKKLKSYEFFFEGHVKKTTQPKIINFDPRAPHQRTRDENGFKNFCENFQDCVPSSSFFLFYDLKSKCADAIVQSTSTVDVSLFFS